MDKKTTTTYGFLRRLILWPVLALWALSMILLTLAVARDFYLQLEDGADFAAELVVSFSGDTSAHNCVRAAGAPYMGLGAEPLLPIVLQEPSGYGTDDWYWGKWELLFGFQAAVAFYDSSGNLILASGDYLRFSYAETFGGESIGATYVDLEALPGGSSFADQYISTHPQGDHFVALSRPLRLTGYWGDHGDFVPTEIVMYMEAPAGSMVIYENPEGIRNGEAPVVLYTEDAFGHNYEPGGAIPVDLYYAEDHNPDESGHRSILNAGYMDIEDAILTDNFKTDFGYFNAHIAATAHYDNGDYVRVFVYCSPLEYAMLRLLPTYLVSLLLVVVGLWLCLRAVKHRLTDPLAVILRSYEQDRVELSLYAASPLAELQMLGRHFEAAQQDRHKSRNRVTQLETSLEYAQNAEASRRKWISAIAHELKTPLAVIHGYAEGLREGIAREKRERYLNIILEESEKIDELVRQMLELSRLEAGKVRLSAGLVDLSAMTREVFETLSLQAQQKGLQTEFRLESAELSADRALLEQAVTNFVSNAIKYSPEGGRIRVAVTYNSTEVRFAIENESAPLSSEALEKVWESFYRADTARDRSGTGLGLAITKNIIELHRGSCAVRNTKTGVEFSFRIPK